MRMCVCVCVCMFVLCCTLRTAGMIESEIEALFDACLLTDEEMAQFEEYMQDQPNTVAVR